MTDQPISPQPTPPQPQPQPPEPAPEPTPARVSGVRVVRHRYRDGDQDVERYGLRVGPDAVIWLPAPAGAAHLDLEDV